MKLPFVSWGHHVQLPCSEREPQLHARTVQAPEASADEEQEPSRAIEADAIFHPDSDPATHVLPSSYTSSPVSSPHHRELGFDVPDSFAHEPTPAPDPAATGLGGDPLDPDIIAQTIADNSIYEDLYNEWGMGGDPFPNSDDEDSAWDSAEESDSDVRPAAPPACVPMHTRGQ
jgi:hypothetical protein